MLSVKIIASLSILLLVLSGCAEQDTKGMTSIADMPDKVVFVCGSDDSPLSIFVNYPKRGTPKIQQGDKNARASVDEDFITSTDKAAIRFDYYDAKNEQQSFVIYTGDRTPEDVARRVYTGIYYDFSQVESGETMTGVTYVCFSDSEIIPWLPL